MKKCIFKPSDTELMTEKFRIEKGGICGQACLASIEKCTIKRIIIRWNKMELQFKGWSSWKDLKKYLENRNYTVKQVSSNIEYDPSKHYIARVQWIGEGKNKDKPFYGWKHWTEASSYTHFIAINNEEFYCNEFGVYPIETIGGYMESNKGCITSHFEIGEKEKT